MRLSGEPESQSPNLSMSFLYHSHHQWLQLIKEVELLCPSRPFWGTKASLLFLLLFPLSLLRPLLSTIEEQYAKAIRMWCWDHLPWSLTWVSPPHPQPLLPGQRMLCSQDRLRRKYHGLLSSHLKREPSLCPLGQETLYLVSRYNANGTGYAFVNVSCFFSGIAVRQGIPVDRCRGFIEIFCVVQ